jgi:plasmid maintenance system killer protein
MTWTVVEERDAVKVIDALPPQVAGKYTTWLSIVREQGPQGLRAIKGFHDEKLGGELKQLRSSRLNQQWRVIYRVESNIVTVYVERITPHDYRR